MDPVLWGQQQAEGNREEVSEEQDPRLPHAPVINPGEKRDRRQPAKCGTGRCPVGVLSALLQGRLLFP